MATGQRVLVVDGLLETEEVLKAVLEPRGLTVQRVRAAAPPAAEPCPPSVVVLHEETVDARHRDLQSLPRIIIGSVRVPEAPESSDHTGAPAHYLPKPFHYRDLIDAIESLLDRSPRPASLAH